MPNESTQQGVLLLNLGTPDSPEPKDVGRYLTEFLLDPYVIDIPAPLRWFLVRVLIVPRRKHASSELYKKIWEGRGSPLLFHTLDLASKVRVLLAGRATVKAAMRYGSPSLRSRLAEFHAEGVRRVKVFPLYPQYSIAATLSSIEKAKADARAISPDMELSFVPAFYDKEPYLRAVADVSRPALAERPHDKVLFSFHGLPERQVKKTDHSGGKHCLMTDTCCDRIGEANRDCYRAQSFATARFLAMRLGIPKEKYLVGFQSRLGRTPWIRPYSDEYYRTLAGQGVKRLAVLCPSFTADCLETLEEVSMRGLEEFRRHGGEDLFLVPSVNSSDVWARAVVELLGYGG